MKTIEDFRNSKEYAIAMEIAQENQENNIIRAQNHEKKIQELRACKKLLLDEFHEHKTKVQELNRKTRDIDKEIKYLLEKGA